MNNLKTALYTRNEQRANILKKMGESIKKIGTLTPTEAQQLAQTLKYGQKLERLVDLQK